MFYRKSIRERLSIFTRESRMLRASLPSSGRPSVCPSVTLVSCIKTVQARITKSSPWTAPRSLVYRDKISCHWVQGFPSNVEIDQDNLHMKFSAFNVDFSCPSPDPLGSRRPALAGVKDSYPPKKWLFYRNFLA